MKFPNGFYLCLMGGASNMRCCGLSLPSHGWSQLEGKATAVHDWFYSVEGPDIGRLKADYVLYCMARFRGARTLEAQAIKTGVNLLGMDALQKRQRIK